MPDPNFSRVFSFNDYTRKYYAVGQIFNGRVSLDFWLAERTQGPKRPVIKILFNSASLYLFKRLLTKCLEDDAVKPVEIGFWPFIKNETSPGSTPTFKGALTVGRDQEKRIYLEAYGDQHKEPIRLMLSNNEDIKLNGSEIPTKQSSEITAGSLISTIDQVLQLGTFFTLNNNPSATTNNTQARSEAGTPTPADPFSDDVPF